MLNRFDVGCSEGLIIFEGFKDGLSQGVLLGTDIGPDVKDLLGDDFGPIDGFIVGDACGDSDDFAVGESNGDIDGLNDEGSRKVKLEGNDGIFEVDKDGLSKGVLLGIDVRPNVKDLFEEMSGFIDGFTVGNTSGDFDRLAVSESNGDIGAFNEGPRLGKFEETSEGNDFGIENSILDGFRVGDKVGSTV